MKRKIPSSLILILFLCSGIVSLLFQIVWLKNLVLVFGNTVWAVSTLLTTFMAGLAIGSWLFGRIADRVTSPLRLYGILAGGTGLYGLLTPLIFAFLPRLYIPIYTLSGGDTFMMGVFKFALAFLILWPPTLLMGGTLPLLAKHCTADAMAAGASIGILYTINTLGAVFGTFLAGFVFIPAFGLRMTVLIAVFLSILILLMTLGLTRGESARFHIQGLFRIARTRHSQSWMLAVYFVCGFAALAYEVLWNRILVLHLGSSVYAYSVLLVVYLLGVTLGSAIMSHYVPKIQHPLLVFAGIQLLLAFDVILVINQFDLLSRVMALIQILLGVQSHASHVLLLFFGVFQVLILPTLLFGASFPLAIALFVEHSGEIGREAGLLYASNTFGNILGSFCTGFLILPLIGAQHGLLLIASLNLLVGIYLLTRSAVPRSRQLAIGAASLIVFYGGYTFFTYPNQVILTAGVFQETDQNQVNVIAFEEDIYATVSVEEHTDVRGTWRQLSMNGTNVAGTSCELFTIQKLQGHLPLLLHHDPQSVLHIGFGSGGTAHAVSRYPVKQITIAEISKSVIQKAADYFLDVNHHVLEDPRLKIEFTDGRNKVLASPEKYDVILSDSIHPRFSGNGSLYTHEYYQLLKERLNAGGVVSQWLPFYSITPENFKMIIRSFYEVFPNTSVWFVNSTLNSYVIVIGTLDRPQIDYTIMKEKLQIPEVAADLREIQTDSPYKILDYFLFANEVVGEYVKGAPLHTDDNMAVEYISGRAVNRWQTSYDNYVELLAHRTSVKAYLTHVDRGHDTPEDILAILGRYEAATTHNLIGQKLFYEGKRAEAFAEFEKIPQINPEDLEPVEYFGAPFQAAFLRNAAIPQK